MPFYIFAWTASVIYGFYAIVAKLAGKYQLKNVWQFSFFSLFFGAIITSVIALANGARLAPTWGFIVLASLSFALGGILYLVALEHIDVSVMAPLFSLRVVVGILLGFIFLHETLSSTGVLLAILIIIAGFFAAMDEHFSLKSFFSKGVIYSLLFMAILSIQSVFINRAIAQTDYWTATLWIGIIASIIGFIFLYPKFKTDLIKTPARNYLGVTILSVLGGLGDLAAFKAFEGNIGISTIIISLPFSMIMAFAFSVFKPALLEKHTLKVYLVRFTAATVMIWGALQLSN